MAFYLPQYQPTPENDEWWGPGFTEWTNVARARPLFRGHKQPDLPGELGFYDLRLPETRAAQGELAAAYGVEGFLYYHYWFAGRRVLDRVESELLKSREAPAPFALAWANQTWTGIWHGAPNRTLIEQTYPGIEDTRRHFDAVLPALTHPSYITVDGKPLFYIYNPQEIPDLGEFCDEWRRLASANGLPGIYFVAERKGLTAGPSRGLTGPVDAWTYVRLPPAVTDRWSLRSRIAVRRAGGRYRLGVGPTVYSYDEVARTFATDVERMKSVHPCVIPNWDNTPRSGRRGRVLIGSSPEAFAQTLGDAVKLVAGKPEEHRLIFLKSWNEWAEGNYVEPSREEGRRWLEAVRDCVV